MMWDDHDIVDGWGSYPPERQSCPVFREGIGPAATKAFQVFQKQQPAGTPPAGSLFPGSFSQGFTIGQVGILALDMRSERTIDQVLSPGHWRAVYDWMDGLDGIGHLLVMSSIPLVYPSLRALEDLVVAFPGRQDLEDDLRDRWSSDGHRVERLRLVRRLLDLAEREKARVTIVSGDVHVAALGYLESRREEPRSNAAVINQLTSSGIVHPGPGAGVHRPRPGPSASSSAQHQVQQVAPGQFALLLAERAAQQRLALVCASLALEGARPRGDPPVSVPT